MKLLRGDIVHLLLAKGTVATVGNFDGVHRGHQALLAQLKAEARRRQLPLVVLLFEPQPSEFFLQEEAPPRLTSLREKMTSLASCGVDYVCCLKFDAHLAAMSPKQFVKKYFFSHFRVNYLLLGADFRFGHKREGDVTLLQRFFTNAGSTLDIFSDYCFNGQRISSTLIRHALKKGHLREAAALLGRWYSICGRVVKGDARGRQWGVPTANVLLQRYSLPLGGVFSVIVARANGQILKGVANLGCRPTVDGIKKILEIHLFDFSEDIYGDMLHVYFLHKLRDEIKFSSLDALITQIHHDIAEARQQFEMSSFEFNPLSWESTP